MFSATFNDAVIDRIKSFVGVCTYFLIPKEALRLKGVQNFKIRLSPEEKVDFVEKLHTKLSQVMTMVFVNKKESALVLQNKLEKEKIKAKLLIGGIENEARD